MYKLLIAEDEVIERTTFKMLISKYLPEIEVVAEASNGREAIQLGMEFKPDIIIIDIKMPGINGIEAIKLLKSDSNIESQIIVLTAYDNFDYIQEALSVGVVDYLLKPAKREKIIQTIKKAIEKVDENRVLLESKKKVDEKLDEIKPFVESEFISDLVLGNNDINEQEKRLSFLNIPISGGYCVIISIAYGTLTGEMQAIKDGFSNKKIRDFLLNRIKAKNGFSIASRIANNIVVFFPIVSPKDDYQIMLDSIDLATGIYKEVHNIFQNEVCIGIGSYCSRLEDLSRSFKGSAVALKHCRQGNNVIHFGDISNEAIRRGLYPVEKERLLLYALKKCDYDNCSLIIDEIFIWVSTEFDNDTGAVKSYIHGLVSYALRSVLENEPQFINSKLNLLCDLLSLDSIQSIKRWILSVLSEIIEKLSGMGKDKTSGIIEIAVKYISDNYHLDITMDDAARHLKMSPTYFCKVFKLESGKNFTDYLTEYRIEKAKKLLEDKSLSVKEISFDVGYNNPDYFCKVFKKVVGVTPGGYRFGK
jgi:Response regulator containing CheY-like receiver domain and AraC-type DNA-binding domain